MERLSATERLNATLCSRNEHKRRELQALLPNWELRLLEADDFPPETGETYYENARAKALFGRSVGREESWMLGEDSGIEVAALGGRPGVRSARSAVGDEPSWLLRELEGVPREGRAARYVCELVAIAPDGHEFRGTGTLTGRIAAERAGSAGFGFDPVFVPDDERLTVAQLGDDWKRRNSHRARAARSLLDELVRAGVSA